MRHAGIVLAAGASSRMGRPKALLELPDGRPLARAQCDLLKSAGCERAIVVLGCDAEIIRAKLPGCDISVNANWTLGRLGSVQAGLRAAPKFDGYVILPVDTVGVRSATIRGLLAAGNARSPGALRPAFGKKPGRVEWINAELRDRILLLDNPAARLDAWLETFEETVPSQDPAILHNVNTPAEWSAWLETLSRS